MAVNLTCAEITAAYFLADKMWADSAKNADYIAKADAGKALIENTTSQVSYLEDPKKEKEARIYWTKFCNSDVSTTTPNFCTFTGDEADATCKDYAISLEVSKAFTIDEANYVNSNLNVPEVYADNELKTLKALDEKMTKMLIAKLATFTSANQYQSATGLGCSDETGEWITTFIKPLNWTPKVVPYLAKVAMMNKFSNAFVIDGENLYDIVANALLDAGNANGSGAAAAVKMMKIYSDLFNMEAVASGKTYMVDRGATAFVNKSLWKGNGATNPIDRGIGNQIKYSVPSKNLPGVTYDVYASKDCSAQYEKVNVLYHARFDLLNGAEGCDGQTGVLEFECGDCPEIVAGS